MTSDSESKLPAPPRRDLWTLPRIEELKIERVRYRVPRQHMVGGREVAFEGGVEILVQTDGEIPIRALSPALFIGSAEVAENEQVEARLHRFFVLDEAALRPGASITLGWVGQAPPKVGAHVFRYEVPRDTVSR
jgi:hypothetical protein